MTSLVETNSYFLKMALAGKSDVTRSLQTLKENFGYFWPSKNSRQRLSHFVEPVKNMASTEPPFGVGSGMFTNNFFLSSAEGHKVPLVGLHQTFGYF